MQKLLVILSNLMKKETIKSKARSIIIYDANGKEKQLGGNVK